MHARGWEINLARSLATMGDVSMEIQGTWACLDSPPEVRQKVLHFVSCTMKQEACLVGLF